MPLFFKLMRNIIIIIIITVQYSTVQYIICKI